MCSMHRDVLGCHFSVPWLPNLSTRIRPETHNSLSSRLINVLVSIAGRSHKATLKSKSRRQSFTSHNGCRVAKPDDGVVHAAA
jgi:hypothetical protein